MTNIKFDKKTGTAAKKQKNSRNEVILISFMIFILILGVIIEFSHFSLKTLDADLFYSFLTTIVSVQASIIAIGFSFLSIIAAFGKEERYGISVVSYTLKYKHRLLSLRKSLVIELALIIISFVLVALEYMNVLFAIFIDSVLIIVFLSFNLLEIMSSNFNDDMFLFLEQKIACGGYEYLNNYCKWVKKCINDEVFYKYEPAGRIKELWVDQIKRCSNNFLIQNSLKYIID